MAIIVWDQDEDRVYESGVDRGVLFPPGLIAVPWNGLTSIEEKFDQERKAIYWDGRKINDYVVLGDFEATMKALTYPDEFIALEGMTEPVDGKYLGNQKPIPFGLSYRTLKGNALDADLGYKIHILYNVTAIPTDKAFETLTDSASFVEFEWDISAIPEEATGYRPTAHIVIDSNRVEGEFLTSLESLLYGTEGDDPVLPSFEEVFV